MKVQLLLADSAQVLDGKVYALGLAWSLVGTPTPPHALVILIDVDWNETNRPFKMKAELVDSDMNPVMIQTEIGQQPVQIEGDVEVGRPPGLPHGTPVRIPIATNFGPLNLTAGLRYEWRLTIDTRPDDVWSESFTVRPG